MAQFNSVNLIAFYNGVRLKKLTSLSLTTESGQQRIDLMNEGLGGFSSGSGSVTIEIGYAIPISGTEVPYQQDNAAGNFVTMQVQEGPVSYIGTGKVTNNGSSQSVGAATEGTASWTGELAPMK